MITELRQLGRLLRDAPRYAVLVLGPVLFAVVPGEQQSSAADQTAANRMTDMSVAEAALQNPSIQVRVDTVTALGSMSADARVIPLLVRAVGDSSEHVRRTAAFSLAKLAATHHEVIAPLVHALGDADPLVQDNAVWGLQSTGPAAFPALADAVKSPDVRVRVAALEALQTIFTARGGRGIQPRAIETLIEALGDASADVRAASARSLGSLGGPARTAVPRLTTVSSTDSVDYVRTAAADALRRIARIR